LIAISGGVTRPPACGAAAPPPFGVPQTSGEDDSEDDREFMKL
jgi:hypothetical protein